MKIIDISRPLRPDMPVYPGDIRFESTQFQAGYQGEKLMSAYILMLMKNHHGTHIDFPAHKVNGGKTSDNYSLDYFINRALILDVRQGEVKPELDLTAQAIILFTGKEMGYISEEFADLLLVNYPSLRLIGTDSLTVDQRGTNSAIHRKLLSKDILIVEGLTNLETAMQAYGTRIFELYTMPLALPNADGAPVRAFIGEQK
jgi:arylformamidase